MLTRTDDNTNLSLFVLYVISLPVGYSYYYFKISAQNCGQMVHVTKKIVCIYHTDNMAHGLTVCFFEKFICIIYIIKFMILSTLCVKKIPKKSQILSSFFLVFRKIFSVISFHNFFSPTRYTLIQHPQCNKHSKESLRNYTF